MLAQGSTMVLQSIVLSTSAVEHSHASGPLEKAELAVLLS